MMAGAWVAALPQLTAGEASPSGPVADLTPTSTAHRAAEVIVLPGVSPRRLAVVVVTPRAGESLPSWVDRAAADTGIPAGRMALRLGLEIRDQPGAVQPLFHGTVLTERSRLGLAARHWSRCGRARRAAAVQVRRDRVGLLRPRPDRRAQY